MEWKNEVKLTRLGRVKLGEMEEIMWMYVARCYYGGDSALSIIFENKEDRDEFVRCHDYANKSRRTSSKQVWSEDGSHWGILCEKTPDGKFIDIESGAEL